MSYRIRDQMPKEQRPKPDNFFYRQAEEGKGNRKLTEDMVQAIRRRLRAGESQRSISDHHVPEIGQSTVGDINTKRIWGWLEDVE
jgi:hypothetical protein